MQEIKPCPKKKWVTPDVVLISQLIRGGTVPHNAEGLPYHHVVTHSGVIIKSLNGFYLS